MSEPSVNKASVVITSISCPFLPSTFNFTQPAMFCPKSTIHSPSAPLNTFCGSNSFYFFIGGICCAIIVLNFGDAIFTFPQALSS